MKVFPWISIICFAQIWKPSFLRSKKLSPIKEISTAGFACNSLYRRTRITWRTKCKMWIFIGFLDLKNLYLQMHWNTMWGIAMIIWRPLKEYDAASFQPYIIFYILHYFTFLFANPQATPIIGFHSMPVRVGFKNWFPDSANISTNCWYVSLPMKNPSWWVHLDRLCAFGCNCILVYLTLKLDFYKIFIKHLNMLCVKWDIDTKL